MIRIEIKLNLSLIAVRCVQVSVRGSPAEAGNCGGAPHPPASCSLGFVFLEHKGVKSKHQVFSHGCEFSAICVSEMDRGGVGAQAWRTRVGAHLSLNEADQMTINI